MVHNRPQLVPHQGPEHTDDFERILHQIIVCGEGFDYRNLTNSQTVLRIVPHNYDFQRCCQLPNYCGYNSIINELDANPRVVCVIIYYMTADARNNDYHLI